MTSQIEDTTVAMAFSVSDPSKLSVAPHVTDPRRCVVSALAVGTAFVFGDQNPTVGPSRRSQVQVTVVSPPANARVDFVSADDPV